MVKSFAYLFLVFLILTSCRRSVNSMEALQEYVLDPDNGLIQEIEVGGMKLQVTYRPPAMLERQLNTGMEDDEINAVKNQLDTLYYFVLSFSHNGNEIETNRSDTEIGLSETINYLSTGIADELIAMADGDTLKPIDVSYSRMYGTGNSTNVMAVFGRKKALLNGHIDLIYSDSYLGIGTSTFSFQEKDIKDIPDLILP